MDRPESVKKAVLLLYASIVIAVISSFIMTAQILPEVSPDIFLIAFLILCIGFGLTWFLTYMMGQGKGWARTVFCILFIIGLPFSFKELPQAMILSKLYILILIGQIAMQGTALFFLYQKSSSRWFQGIGKNEPTELEGQCAQRGHQSNEIYDSIYHVKVNSNEESFYAINNTVEGDRIIMTCSDCGQKFCVPRFKADDGKCQRCKDDFREQAKDTNER